jgi:RimJ/RimL family protein N-acetyltransferase
VPPRTLAVSPLAGARQPWDDAPVTDPNAWTTRFDDDTSRLLLERGGVASARMEILATPPSEYVFFHPRADAAVDPVAAAEVLVRDGLRRAGAARVKLILEERFPHSAAYAAAAPKWGFELDAHKLLYRAQKAELKLDGIETPPGARFFAGDPELADVFGRVLSHSPTESDRAADPQSLLAEYEFRCRTQGEFHPEDWVVLRIDGRSAGLVLPAFADASRGPATNLYVGVDREFAGRGLGAVLVRRGIETMLARGATRYIGSCDVRNAAMIRIFERVGCARVTGQHVFVRPAATLPR